MQKTVGRSEQQKEEEKEGDNETNAEDTESNVYLNWKVSVSVL